MIDPIYITAGTGLLTIGAAWGAVRTGLNGSRKNIADTNERVTRMDDKFDAHVKADDTVQRDLLTRTARIEASTAHMQADLTEIKAILRAANTPE
jgi:hypothetical protein